MSNLYMDKEYVIAGYIIGDETTNVFQAINVFQAMITYETAETTDSITYTFNVLDRTTAKEAALLHDTELRLSNGKNFVIPMGHSTYSVVIPKASLIDNIVFENTNAINDINAKSLMIGTKKVELVESLQGTTKYKTIYITEDDRPSTLNESAKVTLNTGEIFYLSNRNIRKTVKEKIDTQAVISKIATIESTGDVNYIAPTTSANKTFAATDLTKTFIAPKTIFHLSKGTECVEQMGINVGSLVFDNEISLTGKVYYQVDDDILSVNKLKSFKNIRDLFALRDLRK